MDGTQNRLETLFDAALDLKTPGERSAFLARECATDAAMRARLERLLWAHERSEGFFDDCLPALHITKADAVENKALYTEEETGRLIGAYKLLQKVGEGGCGVVYLAEQDKPVRRRVALKVIKLGMDTKNVIARFEAERQALAMMDHPNIARVLDAGATQTGRPYFVMELVSGVRITEYCDQHRLDVRQRLDLFIQVCHAIQHAHQKGIIHRDIKPSNILVTLHDGVPVPKVIDFGIAKAVEEKLTDKTLFTVHGNLIGTPTYMSPEQAELSGLDIDTRSDVYSLGVLLYELLTGKTPFEQGELLASGLDAMRQILRERDPLRPSSRLTALLPDELALMAMRHHVEAPRLKLLLVGDLDWVVMKALEKDRGRRYATANGLAMDVRRFLGNEPVLARPPSRLYRFRKLVRRNRAVFISAGTVMVTLLVGLGAATWMFFKERDMRHRAVAAEHAAERARANEAALRRQAETREKITQAALLISQGKLAAADNIAANVQVRQPTLEGASVLRTLGKWNALNQRWQLAADRYQQAVQINQLNSSETRLLDFLAGSAALMAAGQTNQFIQFRRNMLRRFGAETDPALAAEIITAALPLPISSGIATTLRRLANWVAPVLPACVGGPNGPATENFLARLKLRDIGTKQPCAMRVSGDDLTLVAGGANIWGTQDGCAYASAVMPGNFDFRLKVRSITPHLNDYTRVGLMVREFRDVPGSRYVMVAVNAGNTFQVMMRPEDGAQAISVPQNPLPAAYGSNSWVRLQRAGDIFHAYVSSNGVDWTQLYQTTGGGKPFTDSIYFGIAASSHDPNSVATNALAHFGPTPTVSVDGAVALAWLDYRTGQFEATANWCRQLLANPECKGVQTEMTRTLLALACWKLHQAQEARHELRLARAATGEGYMGEPGSGNQQNETWYDWVFLRELLAEATELVKN